MRRVIVSILLTLLPLIPICNGVRKVEGKDISTYVDNITLITSDSLTCRVFVKIVVGRDSVAKIPLTIREFSIHVRDIHDYHAKSYTADDITNGSDYFVKVFVDIGKLLNLHGIVLKEYITSIK